jgi:glutamine synthetase
VQRSPRGSGIRKKLPATLAESLNALEEFDWNELGLAPAAATYGKIKRYELASLGKLTDDARMALLMRDF